MPEERHQIGYVVSSSTASVADQTACRTTVSTNCDTSYNYNQGCGTQVQYPDSYGQGFNSGGGGYYALARNKEYGIKVWFWPRHWPFVPEDVRCDDGTANPDSWGPPTAYFPTGENCGYEEHFNAHMFIFDLTFCVRWVPSLCSMRRYLFRDFQGDWAGSPDIWSATGCSPMSCNDCKSCSRHRAGLYANGDTLPVVDQNPEAFADAYWEVNSLRVYTPVVN